MSESRTELEKEIDRTREHLAETVDALTGKLDVKSRAKGKAADVKEAAQHKAQDADARRAATLVAIGIVAVVGVIIYRRGA